MPNPAQFLELPELAQNTSKFQKNWTNTMTLKMGYLVPIICKEVLPGDHWRGRANIFMRYQPLYAPVMHKVNLFTHFFYVPARILWNNSSDDSFETFQTGGRDGKKQPIPPFFKLIGQRSITHPEELVGFSTLADYLNVNVQHLEGAEVFGLEFSQLPFRAYQAICDEYYRNKNLQDSYFNEVNGLHVGGIVEPSEVAEEDYQIQGNDITFESLMTLRRRLWEDDYFTSALPTPERGDPVNIPFSTSNTSLNVVARTGSNLAGLIRNRVGDAITNPSFLSATVNGLSNRILDFDTQVLQDAEGRPILDGDGHNAEPVLTSVSSVPGTGSYYYDPNGTLYTTGLGNIRNSATIRDLRIATLAERFQEISMNTLPDYRHFVNAFFDVVVPDYRLQLPELVGGGRQPVSFSEVTQTSADSEITIDEETVKSPQGNLAGHGVSVPFAAQDGHNFEFYAPEHGFIIGIMSVMPKTAYCQGLPRMYSRYDRFDYFVPLFETLPFQEVRNKELFVQPADPVTGATDNEGTFGYQPRFSEMKWDEDEIHGDVKGNLNFWTMARLFKKTDTPPALNVSFVTSDPTSRIFNNMDDNVDKLIAMIDFDVDVTRRMSKYTRI